MQYYYIYRCVHVQLLCDRGWLWLPSFCFGLVASELVPSIVLWLQVLLRVSSESLAGLTDRINSTFPLSFELKTGFPVLWKYGE